MVQLHHLFFQLLPLFKELLLHCLELKDLFLLLLLLRWDLVWVEGLLNVLLVLLNSKLHLPLLLLPEVLLVEHLLLLHLPSLVPNLLHESRPN